MKNSIFSFISKKDISSSDEHSEESHLLQGAVNVGLRKNTRDQKMRNGIERNLRQRILYYGVDLLRHPSARGYVCFAASTALGTVVFMILFEVLFSYIGDYLESPDMALPISYFIAYVISITWQHHLNRMLLYKNGTYCYSLMKTYVVYSISLVITSVFALIIIKLSNDIPPRVTALSTLALSGALNYYLLSICFDTPSKKLDFEELNV